MPTVLQMDAVECGAACLAMVLGRFGRFEPLETLRETCGVSRDGVSAADIVRAAESFGLVSRAFRREIDELAALPMPQVLFWGFNHFVVLEGLHGERFVINDPAHGRRSLDAAEFGRAFTGVTIAFERGAEFVPNRKPPGVLHDLVAQLAGSRDAFLFIIGASLLLVLIGILVPAFTRVFIDDYLIGRFGTWLIPLLLGMLAVAALRIVLTWLHTRALLLLQTKVTISVSAGFLWKLFQLPYAFFVHRSAAEVSGRVQMATQIAGTVSGPLAIAAVNVVAMVGYAAIMLAYSAVLTAVALAFAGLTLLLLLRVTRTMRERSQRLQMATGRAHAAAVQNIALIEDHKATGTEALLFARMMEAEIGLLNAEQSIGRVQKLLGAAPMICGRMLTLAVIGVGAIEVMRGEMTIGALIAFQLLAEMFSAPLTALIGLGTTIQASSSAVTRLRDVLDHAPDPTCIRAAEPNEEPRRLGGRIEAEALTFGYAPLRPVLQDVSLAVEPGSMVAILGLSGSGKTTLGRLLVGLVSPWSGELRYDGTPLRELSPSTLAVSMGYVDQTPYFATGRVRDALTLWDATISDDDMERAARDACIHDVVVARPGGYDGRIGESGAGFSGGERQRLAIARALVHDPSILLLDEATSALDVGTEQEILANLRRRGVTTIMITHRPSAVACCDRVVIMDRGRIVADGDPDMPLAPACRRLLEAE